MSDEGLAALHKEAQTHTGHAYIRPKDASTLLILDRSGSALRVLMGKRHQRHTFMPGKFVFPGGRVDPGDSRVAVASSYHPEVERKLAVLPKGGKLTPSRLKALAVAAVRETYEEAGLFIGRQTGRQWPAKGDFQAFSSGASSLTFRPYAWSPAPSRRRAAPAASTRAFWPSLPMESRTGCRKAPDHRGTGGHCLADAGRNAGCGPAHHHP
jgi:8-oxo-dGTP pyrophosphatase MutT (NUDIX family)